MMERFRDYSRKERTMAKIIDGKAISAAIKDELKEQVKAYKEQGIEITLAVVKVGNDPASAVYVRNKEFRLLLEDKLYEKFFKRESYLNGD